MKYKIVQYNSNKVKLYIKFKYWPFFINFFNWWNHNVSTYLKYNGIFHRKYFDSRSEAVTALTTVLNKIETEKANKRKKAIETGDIEDLLFPEQLKNL